MSVKVEGGFANTEFRGDETIIEPGEGFGAAADGVESVVEIGGEDDAVAAPFQTVDGFGDIGEEAPGGRGCEVVVNFLETAEGIGEIVEDAGDDFPPATKFLVFAGPPGIAARLIRRGRGGLGVGEGAFEGFDDLGDGFSGAVFRADPVIDFTDGGSGLHDGADGIEGDGADVLEREVGDRCSHRGGSV